MREINVHRLYSYSHLAVARMVPKLFTTQLSPAKDCVTKENEGLKDLLLYIYTLWA